MSWLARLKNLKTPDDHARKPRKPGSLGFLASPPEHFQKRAEPANDPKSAPADASPPVRWALDLAYQAHHWGCPVCIGAGQGRGLRCGTGAALWTAYRDAPAPDCPLRPKAPAAEPPPPSPAPDRDPMTAAEVECFMARVQPFTGIGVDLARAESLADKLVLRDREGDDRRMCIECQHCNGRACGQPRGAGLSRPELGELALRLQRCDQFNPAGAGASHTKEQDHD